MCSLDDMNTRLEFERISSRIMYFDTNVISYFYDPTIIRDDYLRNKVFIAKLLTTAFIDRKTSVFPYSLGHLRDILSGSEEYEKQKLQFLEEHSGRWKVTEEKNSDLIRLDKYFSIFDDYKSLKDSTEEVKPIVEFVYAAMAPLFHEIADKFAVQLYAPDNQFDSDLVYRLVSLIQNYGPSSGLEMARVSKRIKSSKIYVNGKRVVFPILKKDSINLSRAELIDAVDKAISKISPDIGGYEDYLSFLCKQFPQSTMSIFSTQVIALASLCEAIGLVSEKMNKNSSFEGVISDYFHLAFGLRSHFLVSADQNLLIKARFIKKWLDLPVKIFDIDELILEILNSGIIEKFALPSENNELVIPFSSESPERKILLFIGSNEKGLFLRLEIKSSKESNTKE